MAKEIKYVDYWKIDTLRKISKEKWNYQQPLKLDLCPSCETESLGYHAEENAPWCLNCGWMEKTKPAPDVHLWFLEKCFKDAKQGRTRELIAKILDLTKSLFEDKKDYQLLFNFYSISDKYSYLLRN